LAGVKRNSSISTKNRKKEPFDFCFLNIQDLTARRNFEEETLWDTEKKKKAENSDESQSESESESESEETTENKI